MKEAFDLVIIDGLSIRNVAERKGPERNTLHTYLKKTKNYLEFIDLKMSPNYSRKKIFNQEKEKSVEDYLVKCWQINYGLTKVNVQRMVYKLVIKNKKNNL